MSKISYEERRKNCRLTEFSELREVVIANAVKRTVHPSMKQEESNASLFDF